MLQTIQLQTNRIVSMLWMGMINSPDTSPGDDPVFGIFNENSEIDIHTNTRECNIKAVLMQIQKEVEIAIAYAYPEVKTWFLVKQNSLPILICATYALFVTLIGPAIMKNRKPLTLRKPMIVFNLFLVASYSIALLIIAADHLTAYEAVIVVKRFRVKDFSHFDQNEAENQ
ncbi:elongation of very long chain fatty acids protein [Caerostris darwini]|uniref:Elongation of very long chain fatty acids protein n=1 Tax=Caerostris darwini TaxID=1538125 RepID=A0AAV4SNR0_9ARAC|nr:elongation of very long chain fatty acids protein [Caerostris darwini]